MIHEFVARSCSLCDRLSLSSWRPTNCLQESCTLLHPCCVLNLCHWYYHHRYHQRADLKHTLHDSTCMRICISNWDDNLALDIHKNLQSSLDWFYRHTPKAKLSHQRLKWLSNQHFSCLQFNPCPKNVCLDTKIRILSGLEAKIVYSVSAILENGCRWGQRANLRWPYS